MDGDEPEDLMKLMIWVVLLFPSFALAGGFGQLVCKECNFKTGMMSGPTMSGHYPRTFFCKKTKEFVVRTVVADLNAPKQKHEGNDIVRATPTKQPVVKNSKHLLHSDATCLNALVPVDYYLENPKVPCPVCNKGKVEYENQGFAD